MVAIFGLELPQWTAGAIKPALGQWAIVGHVGERLGDFGGHLSAVGAAPYSQDRRSATCNDETQQLARHGTGSGHGGLRG